MSSLLRNQTRKQQLRRVMGVVGRAAVQHCDGAGAALDCGGGAQRHFFRELVDFAALFFFLPTAFVIVELSTRFPEEGGLYAWSKEAFGEFHGFVAGWTYWVYTFFYFPALLDGERGDGGVHRRKRLRAHLAQNRTFLMIGSFRFCYSWRWSLNIIGLEYRKVAAERGGRCRRIFR